MSAALPSIQLPVDYNNLFNEITDFLVTFKQDTLSSDATRNENEDENLDAENIEQHLLEKGPKYMAMLQKVANRELEFRDY
ncbi:DNA replication licensing factor MCM7 [Fusarium falciforme]|nr:DNA replication licensing factor MCM7 [Fusarium falciforme]